MSLFKILRRPSGTPSAAGSRASTPPFEDVQAPFAQLGSASQPAPVLGADEEDIRRRFRRIRILIIGRANSGKTTILQKVCGTTDKPIVYNDRGKMINKANFLTPSSDRGLHDINNATIFPTNPGFIFHDSPGFEAGGAQELNDAVAFLDARSASADMDDQIHAVWYCIPLDDDRPFLTAEIKFFSECGAGNVPVIVIFTKFDAMDDKAFGELTRSGVPMDDARMQAPDHAKVMFDRDLRDILSEMKYPPKSHVLLRNMNHRLATCKELVECTAGAIDNEGLKLLFISSQRSNLALCMKSAMNKLGAIFCLFGLKAEYIKTPDIQNELNDLVAAQEASDSEACFAAVFIIILDLSFFIWDKKQEQSKECFSEALSIYKEATTNHEAVMEAVVEALRTKQGDSREKAFRARMTDIVLAHRLTDNYRAETGTG
ncbi:hypothetical protein FIBSPDRAFT_1054588 [Athelia psychrophila]|uniref:Uncharacterized protein n=1 Tax=Athelia psychrophila TaxID=1759441 RepID=A0A167V2T5_9AGAM|nr:hypothetical protein FIBSPDRAFT_1054588 [Fibularhizoctonia sp. CBS 109695]